MPVAHLPHALQGLVHRRRRVALDHRDEVGTDLADGLLDRLEREHLTPGDLADVDLGAAPLRDLAQQVAEAAEHGDEDAVAGVDEGDERRLDARAAGAVDEDRRLVASAEHLAGRAPGSRSCSRHRRVVLADELRGHGPQDAGSTVIGRAP